MAWTAEEKKEYAQKKATERKIKLGEELVAKYDEASSNLAKSIKELIIAETKRNAALRDIDGFFRKEDLNDLRFNKTEIDYSKSHWSADSDTINDHADAVKGRAAWRIKNINNPAYAEYFKDLKEGNLKSITEKDYPADYAHQLKEDFKFVNEEGTEVEGTVEFRLHETQASYEEKVKLFKAKREKEIKNGDER